MNEGRGDMPTQLGERRGLKVGQRDLPIKLSIVVGEDAGRKNARMHSHRKSNKIIHKDVSGHY